MKKNKSEPVKTVLTITIGFLVVYLVSKWRWSLNVALIIGLCGLFSTFLAKKIDFVWMKLTWVLSLIVPNILLSLIFYVFLTPIALLSKVFQKHDQLLLKNTVKSTFKTYNKQFDKRSFENPW